jgi:hypothetical protein
MHSYDSNSAQPVTEPDHTPASEQSSYSSPIDELLAAAADPALTEDLALALLKRADLAAEVIELLSKNGGLMRSRKVRLALVQHPHAPRHVTIPMVAHLFTFDLMQVALAPVVPADVKIAADQALINRLEKISSGEKLSLARRASGRVAGALLLDPEPRVMQTALENSRLTEAGVIRALLRHGAPSAFVEAVCRHAKWSVRREVRIALLRNEKTPLARALEFARILPRALVHEILQGSRLPGNIKSYVMRELQHEGSASIGRNSQL